MLLQLLLYLMLVELRMSDPIIWAGLNFAHNEFLSLQWIYSDIDLKKKRKKYFWWENIFSTELVTAQVPR